MGKTAVKKKEPFLFSICGWKNAGKTVLITKLIPVLKQRGYQVATIKHDGHEFEGDVPGTDTYKHLQSGAYGSAVFSAAKFMITKQCEGITEKELCRAFPEADIILLEGFKNSNYPKYMIEECRKDMEMKEICRIADYIIDLMEGKQSWEK